MADQRLRDLERRWKETGAVEDEAAYLLERVRVGDLRQERLELAAYCGHEAACTLATVQSEPDLMQWVVGLQRWGSEALVRAAIAAYRVQLRRGVAYQTEDSGQLLISAQEWAACPCEDHLEEVRRWSPRDASGMFLRQCVLMEPDLIHPHPWQDPEPCTTADWAAEIALRSDPAQARHAIREEIVLWSLGHDDPCERHLSGRGST